MRGWLRRFVTREVGADRAKRLLAQKAAQKRWHRMTPNKNKGTMAPSIKTRRTK